MTTDKWVIRFVWNICSPYPSRMHEICLFISYCLFCICIMQMNFNYLRKKLYCIRLAILAIGHRLHLCKLLARFLYDASCRHFMAYYSIGGMTIMSKHSESTQVSTPSKHFAQWPKHSRSKYESTWNEKFRLNWENTFFKEKSIIVRKLRLF